MLEPRLYVLAVNAALSCMLATNFAVLAQVDEKGNITESCFKTFGCGSAIASSSVATEWSVLSCTVPFAGLLYHCLLPLAESVHGACARGQCIAKCSAAVSAAN